MKLVADFCIIPMDGSTSIAPYVGACQKILEDAGLTLNFHACGTNIEGEWDAVMAAVKACHEAVHAKGCPRVWSTVHLGTRFDHEESIDGKMDRAQQERNQASS